MTKRPVYKRAIWWIKNDLRLRDNRALLNALNCAKNVLPVFVFEPELLAHPQTSNFHVQARHQALTQLQKRIRKHGGGVYCARGDLPNIFDQIKDIFDFEAIFSYQETGTRITFERDKRVAKWCKKHDVTWREYSTNGIKRGPYDRDRRLAFWNREIVDTQPIQGPRDRQWERFSPPLPDGSMPSLKQLGIERMDAFQDVTEKSAQETLRDFLHHRGKRYSGNISSMNTAPTHCSRLSVHLAWGTLSIRQVFHTLQDRLDEIARSNPPEAGLWKRSLTTFKSRLYWHSHFAQRLEDEPAIEFFPINRAFQDAALPYKPDTDVLDAWYRGQTGFPMVDACMRCFQRTGYLNFRMRAMVTSFACHVLHLPWYMIMYPMARLMADYVPGIHISQLQMQAGVTGINTIRSYNPKKQLIEHDPKCVFVKKWIPELRRYTPSEILGYDEYNLFQLKSYPKPIVDYADRRKEMLSALHKVKKSRAGRRAAKRVLAVHGSRKSRR